MYNRTKQSLILCAVLGVAAITAFAMPVSAKPTITMVSFGRTASGRLVEIYTLTNSKGAEARIMTYGGTIVSLKMPDRNGKLADIVLGFDNLAAYEKTRTFFGALIGRYGNRIAKGKFRLGGKDYQLVTNNGANHLHGGIDGYDRVVWTAKPIQGTDSVSLELTYLSLDGEEGYPGNLRIRVIYRLTDKNEVKIVYSATTDKETVVNLTHHSFFNLADGGASIILGHQLTLNADLFTPTDAGSIPTGQLRPVKGTPFDFTKATVIGARIDDPDEQLKFGQGYDHNFVLNKNGSELSLAATVYEPKSGREMKLYTTEPGIQFYSGNFLDGSVKGKAGVSYSRRSGFCLEAQHFPDSPNEASFPTTVLKPGQTYAQTTIYSFSTR